MEMRKCFAKGIPVVLLSVFLNIVFLMPGNVAATTLIDRSLQKLTENAEDYQTYVDMAEDYLPADSGVLLNELLQIAQLDLNPEEKEAAVIEISQSACTTYLQLWIYGEILGYFNLFNSLASLLSDVGLLGLILCILGIG